MSNKLLLILFGFFYELAFPYSVQANLWRKANFDKMFTVDAFSITIWLLLLGSSARNKIVQGPDFKFELSSRVGIERTSGQAAPAYAVAAKVDPPPAPATPAPAPAPAPIQPPSSDSDSD